MDTKALDNAILYEDDSLIVLNKPAGWVVNRSHTYTEPTIQDWMETKIGEIPPVAESNAGDGEEEYEYGTPEEIFASRGGVVHRLDKDTSGVLLLAKTPAALFELLRQFRDRETSKEYTALVHGKLVPKLGTIRLPMDRSANDRTKFAIGVDGRMSETDYELIEFYPNLPAGVSPKKGKSYQGFSLVKLHPKTGRTHQIRVHMAAIKHPLVGDQVYAGRKRIQLDGEWCPRQFLHASSLSFVHPISKQPLQFTAPLASDLELVLEKLHVGE